MCFKFSFYIIVVVFYINNVLCMYGMHVCKCAASPPEDEQITPIPFDSFSLTAYSSTFESVSRLGGENSSIAIGPQETSAGGSCQMRRPARRRSHHHPSPHFGHQFPPFRNAPEGSIGRGMVLLVLVLLYAMLL